MKKLLLVVLTWMVLAGESRAEDAPAGTMDAESGMITRTVERVCRIGFRIRGWMLASVIQEGMTDEQVCNIIGVEPGISTGGRAGYTSFYLVSGISVSYRLERTAAGIRFYRVSKVSCFLFLD